MANDVVEKLKTFGLSTYEAQAYHVLLRVGATDAGVVAQKADIPFGRVYDVLNTLVEKNLVQVQDVRPKLYIPIASRIALQNLLSARKRDLDERYATMTQTASELEKQLSVHAKEKESSFYAVSIGEADGRVFLTEKVNEAREEILVNLQFKRYDPLDEALFEAFDAAVKRGVKVRVIVRDEEIPYILESPYADLVARTMMPHLGRALHVRIASGDQVPFGIVDGEKTLVGVKNPLDPESYFALVFVWDPRFGKDLRDRFEEIWRQADADLPGLLAASP